MSYCSIIELERYFPKELIQQVSQFGENPSIVDQCLGNATEEINHALRKHWILPLPHEAEKPFQATCAYLAIRKFLGMMQGELEAEDENGLVSYQFFKDEYTKHHTILSEYSCGKDEFSIRTLGAMRKRSNPNNVYIEEIPLRFE